MDTLVYQSFRADDVPAWVTECLQSVERWARRQGFAYRLFDDRIFDYVPREIAPLASRHLCLLTDYARVAVAKELLSQEWERVVWIDADALVFDPAQLTIDLKSGYSFCREVWLDRFVLGAPLFALNVNNSVSVFCRDQTIIDFYLQSARTLLQRGRNLEAATIGTSFLTQLRRIVEFPLLRSVGTFGPAMARCYLQGEDVVLREYLRHQGSIVSAMNLCNSKREEACSDSGRERWVFDDHARGRVVARLLADQGASLNALFDGGSSSDSQDFGRPLSRYLGLLEISKSLRRTLFDTLRATP